MSQAADLQPSAEAAPLLSVRDLVVRFDTDEGSVTAVDGVSFDIPTGTTVALVGESGCGKSVTAHAILRLLPQPPAVVPAGSVTLDGQQLLELSERRMRKIRGARAAIIFQDPKSALNPVYSIGSQVVEAFRSHSRLGRSAAKRKALAVLERVGFPDPAARFGDFPPELSGGMRQRVMIAIAIACSPTLLIADEPTTALDMLAAAQILALLADLKRDSDMSLLLISHDIALVAEASDHIVVLYAGQVVENGPAAEVLGAPQHPYTRGLLRSIPPLRQRRRRRSASSKRLPTIEGTVPDPRALPSGCRFAERCEEVFEACREQEPELVAATGETLARCLLFDPAVEQTRINDGGSEPPADDDDDSGDADDGGEEPA